MDKNQLKEFMNAIGAVAETTLIFYRSLSLAGRGVVACSL